MNIEKELNKLLSFSFKSGAKAFIKSRFGTGRGTAQQMEAIRETELYYKEERNVHSNTMHKIKEEHSKLFGTLITSPPPGAIVTQTKTGAISIRLPRK